VLRGNHDNHDLTAAFEHADDSWGALPGSAAGRVDTWTREHVNT
jgi:hypothetical protein